MIYCAIDTPDIFKATQIATDMRGLCGIKLGLTFFNKHGAQGVRQVIENSGNNDLFLDLKLHDIPKQVSGAIESLADLKPNFLTIHASGGSTMMRAAKQACPQETKLLAVTVLTSLDAEELSAIGQGIAPKEQVTRLAYLAQSSDVDGIVCSPQEIDIVRKACGNNFILMVPGIRPEGSSLDDQKRVLTPNMAMKAGANHLVIGRPITQSHDKIAMANNIINSL
jgi:orotidine-5'-phosphate decarboxylase